MAGELVPLAITGTSHWPLKRGETFKTSEAFGPPLESLANSKVEVKTKLRLVKVEVRTRLGISIS